MPNMLNTTNSLLKLKKSKSPGQDGVVNSKTSVTCSNVPEALFDPTAAKKHFSKFGHVQRIRLQPKRQMCVIEYDQPSSAERAVLNAGAYDGFMFDVSRYKARVRRHSKRDDDPDWIPDPSVEAELSAMGGTPTYRLTRQKVMDVDSETPLPKLSPRPVKKQSPLKKKVSAKVERPTSSQPVSGIESPVLVASTQTSLSTSEAAMELFQLRSRVSTTPDEQWRTLDARDRVLRGWGGAGSRVQVGGATIGTCRDMCPEKELLHRQAEHQVMTLETVVDSEGALDPRRAVKQYSRSSADQEMPMCYELRPASVLMRTCAYLLHQIADTDRPVSLADWFHFMWDRLRSIRKDITQQALCSAESIRLVEMCARFHAHCAARLADLEHTQFDQKLNTDNLTKCLQTLKHMYADVTPEHKPRESEFRGYVALLNLGDANFWWEIKQLPIEIQKSEDIIFAIKIFNALDNNNYVRFFRLVQDEATYLQACILLRYFNDVRARALARIVKAYAPRGGSRYPAEDMMRALAFESLESLNSFINHYGLRFSRSDDVELSIILDRNQFIEDSDPYPIARAISLIESKRNSSVGKIIAGGKLPEYKEQVIFTSFTKDGKLKESALTAEDQGYNTTNDSNKDINSLKAEIQKLCQGGKTYGNIERPIVDKVLEPKGSLFVKNKPKLPFPVSASDETDSFSFTPAVIVAPTEIIKNTPEKILKDAKSMFLFSPPQEPVEGNLFVKASNKNIFQTKVASAANNIFGKSSNNKQSPPTHSLFGTMKPDENLFKKPEVKSVFSQPCDKPTNVFNVAQDKNIFANKNENNNIQTSTGGKNIFGAKSDSLFSRNTVTFEKGNNIFGKSVAKSDSEDAKRPSNIFGTFGKASITNNLFSKSGTTEPQTTPQSIFSNGGTATNKLSPGTLFKSAVNAPNAADSKSYSIFHSKNKAQTVADNILNSVNAQSASVYEFNQNADAQKELLLERLKDERMKEEKRVIQEKIKREEQERQEELRRKEEVRKRKEEEMKILEERRKIEEQRKQEELKKKLEEARKAELKRKAEEDKKFKERVNKESDELIKELVNELGEETVINLIKEELERFKNLMNYGNFVTDNILEDVCNEICELEMKAEKFRTEKLLKKWFYLWRKQYIINNKKRNLLEDTPVWLTEKTPLEEANYMRRAVENSALKNMNAIHRGYKFIGELKQPPAPKPYNIMEIIRSPLLKRMKQINYPYDKCFFWKVTLVSPGSTKWLHKKINIEKWLYDAFGDKNDHEASKTLIHVGKQSWNHLMDFAISVSLASEDKSHDHAESIEGTNGVLFYMIDNNVIKTIEDILKHKYPYQVIPVAVLIPNTDIIAKSRIECVLRELVENDVISAFKIFVVNSENVSESLNASTKRAMKWIAKNYPQVPPLEIDYLKSICQRYLGNEIWCMLRSNRDERMSKVLNDLHKLIKCYNAAVDKLTVVITNERLFNYASFPLEFQKYLDSTSPYPKPYEFIPSNVKNSENISAIKHIMERLKLPDPSLEFNPLIAVNMQQQMRIYCNQIGWLEDPENVVSKIISVIPEMSDLSMPREDFSKYLAHYDLIDFLNIVVYEMINKLNNFDNRLAIYQKSVLADYRNMPWLYEISAINEMKHKATDHKDAIDYYIATKRRKIEIESLEYLMLEDKDLTLVDESIQEIDDSISKYNNCAEAVKQLELKLEEGKKKSLEFENLLKTALADCY